MAITTATVIGAIGVAVSAAGVFTQMRAQKRQAAAQQQALALQQRQEQVRERQMKLDASRRRREVVREQQRTRAAAVAQTVARGGEQGSGLQGGFGQISGQAGTALTGINQNERFGSQIFGLNRQIHGARMQEAAAGGMMGMGAGLTSLGGMITRSAPAIARIGGMA